MHRFALFPLTLSSCLRFVKFAIYLYHSPISPGKALLFLPARFLSFYLLFPLLPPSIPYHIRHISIWYTTTPSEPSPYPFLDAPVTGVNALKFACGTLYDTGSCGRFSAAVCPLYFLVTGFIYLHSFYVKF